MPTLERAEYEALVGCEIGLSPWIEIDQERIDRFADCTGDRQYIHVDPERARATPFGITVAHGFLTLSLLSEMSRELPKLAGVAMSVNYGVNRLRFVSPVPAGSRVRGRFVLDRLEAVGPGVVQSTLSVTVEVEGREKPALVAEWLVRRYLGGEA
ncbi:Acyl dehydratase [Tistlia consotensis]|uniref:Acyl dehydratase n=1 Tax=Tistlia consotensis USBA 355 TaxID=560819 RepID=A0A1Y6B3B9_9PROT|nr:MaoC family dehydratase [Tistlia consotensis]SME89303.1 Acyl dehydratase [Tistlia consotensis USBA 355]SNR25859.1 Acyl dehydratase [Tistlia consotensis]